MNLSLIFLLRCHLILSFPCRAVQFLHQRTCQELRVDGQCRREMDQLLSELQQLLVGIAIMQDLTLRARDSLVSFGERLSTRLFAAFLRAEVRAQLQCPLKACQEDLRLMARDSLGFVGGQLSTNAFAALLQDASCLFCKVE